MDKNSENIDLVSQHLELFNTENNSRHAVSLLLIGMCQEISLKILANQKMELKVH